MKKRRWRCFAVVAVELHAKKNAPLGRTQSGAFSFDRKRMIDFKKFT